MGKDLEQLLEAKNINPTAMRLLVLDFLLQQSATISLTDLEKGMHPADRITLYRTLKTFQEKGLVHSIDDGSGSVKYALCQSECDDHHHHDLHVHFYCHNCKETFCLEKSVIPVVNLPAQFLAEEMSFLVKGVCDTCSAR
ncbi:transcriptional repressor [Flavihumibacter sp. R14]|nr:transcriptional repressor [Flavihumibacter soli]